MGTLLTATWLAGVEPIKIVDEASVSQVREAVRALAATVGLSAEQGEQLAAAASELAFNQLKHARLGVVGVRRVVRGGVAGVEVIAADQGGGIADPVAALRGQPRTAGAGLGVGLSAAYRLADEMDIDVRRGEGTCVWARKFAGALPRHELGILGRPCAGEPRSGDHAAFVRDDARLVVGVVDGLGHGEPAREAAEVAVATLRANALDPPEQVIDAADHALERTRGAVMSVVHVDLARHEAVHAGVGNVSTRLYRKGVSASFLSSARVLGARQRGRVPVEKAALAGDAVLVMFTDGLVSRADVSGDLELLRQPPLVIAHVLVERFGRADDDALVVVARVR